MYNTSSRPPLVVGFCFQEDGENEMNRSKIPSSYVRMAHQCLATIELIQESGQQGYTEIFELNRQIDEENNYKSTTNLSWLKAAEAVEIITISKVGRYSLYNLGTASKKILRLLSRSRRKDATSNVACMLQKGSKKISRLKKEKKEEEEEKIRLDEREKMRLELMVEVPDDTDISREPQGKLPFEDEHHKEENSEKTKTTIHNCQTDLANNRQDAPSTQPDLASKMANGVMLPVSRS